MILIDSFIATDYQCQQQMRLTLNKDNNPMNLTNLKTSLASLALSFGLAAAPASAQPAPQGTIANDKFPLKGVIIDRTISSNMAGGKRNIKMDCGSLIGAFSNGQPKVVLTVAFVANFDTVNDPSYMAQLSPADRMVISQSTRNFTPNQKDILTMIGHIKAAHGVEMSEVMDGAKACKQRWAP